MSSEVRPQGGQVSLKPVFPWAVFSLLSHVSRLSHSGPVVAPSPMVSAPSFPKASESSPGLWKQATPGSCPPISSRVFGLRPGN